MSLSEPSLKVFVTRLPVAWGEGDVRRYFEPHGQLSSISLFMHDGRSIIHKDLGCAYITFAKKSEAEETIRTLSKSVRDGETERLGGQTPASAPPAFVEYVAADGRPYYWNANTNVTQWDKPSNGSVVRVAPNNYSQPRAVSLIQTLSGTNLFIFHLPNEWGEEDLSRNFGSFGNIISARIMTDKDTGRSRGFGFVSYDNAQSAHSAVRAMNGFSVLGKRLKVQLKKETAGTIPR